MICLGGKGPLGRDVSQRRGWRVHQVLACSKRHRDGLCFTWRRTSDMTNFIHPGRHHGRKRDSRHNGRVYLVDLTLCTLVLVGVVGVWARLGSFDQRGWDCQPSLENQGKGEWGLSMFPPAWPTMSIT